MSDTKKEKIENPERRKFFSRLISIFMASGVVAGYGYFASLAARFLYPTERNKKSWQFVTEVSKMKPGDSLSYTAPDGAKIAIARQQAAGTASDFIALSSTCPHLGCQVHWESQKNRFFCPCHNGAFNPEGMAIAGPPAEAKQSLPKYPLKIDGGLLYVEVPREGLSKEMTFVKVPDAPNRPISRSYSYVNQPKEWPDPKAAEKMRAIQNPAKT